MLKIIAERIVFVSLLSIISLLLSPAYASRVDGLYDVEILVADESAATREQAFKRGLDEVFIRIAGDSAVMGKLKRPPASRYVRQFSYVPVEEPLVDDNDQLLTHRLKIQYNGRAMEKFLLNNGLPAWGDHRPDVVVWLVVRDGRNEYVLKQNQRSQIKATTVEAFSRRGIPVKWPLYDNKDKSLLSVSDIRGGFKEPVIEASQRYSRGPALTGSMIWNGRKWQSSWSLLMDGEDRHWNLDETDHKRLINKSIDQAADALGTIFAVRSIDDKQQAKSVLLEVQAIKSIEDYQYVESYLGGLSAVTAVKPYRVETEQAIYEIVLRSDEHDFINLLKNDAELTEVKPPLKIAASEASSSAARQAADEQKDTGSAQAPHLLSGTAEQMTAEKRNKSGSAILPSSNAADAQSQQISQGDAVADNAAASKAATSNIAAGASDDSSAEITVQRAVYYYRFNRSR